GRRLDAQLVARGLVESAAKAVPVILAGEVYVNNIRAHRPAQLVAADAVVEIRPRRPRFVSRGGEKLASALRAFGIDPTGTRALDVGASTGGFTDCLLQHGAHLVYATDVGTGQLAWTAGSGLVPVAATHSPIAGPDGNLEFFVHLRRTGTAAPIDVDAVVAQAHQQVPRRSAPRR